jgi:hypothetical protein
MKKIGKYLWIYLKDWKNLLAHTLVGVLILSVAFFIPVEPIYRVGLLFVIIAFNILRMRIAKKKKA